MTWMVTISHSYSRCESLRLRLEGCRQYAVADPGFPVGGGGITPLGVSTFDAGAFW